MNGCWAEKIITWNITSSVAVGQNPCLQLQRDWKVGGGSESVVIKLENLVKSVKKINMQSLKFVLRAHRKWRDIDSNILDS